MKFPFIQFKPKKNRIKGIECLNCGKPLRGDENFCSYCGQKNSTKKLSFSTFINNLFSGFLSYDSRFWTTFIPLLTQPGKVSKEYIAGKRARFVNPFQLYLNVSIVFFLILGFSNRISEDENTINDIVETTQTIDSISNNKEKIDSILTKTKEEVAKNYSNDSLKTTETITEINNAINLVNKDSEKPKKYHIQIDSAETNSFTNKIEDFINYYKIHPKEKSKKAIKNLGYNVTFWNTLYYNHIKNSYTNYNQIKDDGGKRFTKKLTSLISISLFVFLPIFTLFLMLLYFRRNYTYMEHLVFVFNTQTVFFLLLTIFLLLNLSFNIESTAWVFTALFIIYLYKALRNFYQQSRRKTIVKFIFLNMFYLFLGLLGIIIVSAISFTTS